MRFRAYSGAPLRGPRNNAGTLFLHPTNIRRELVHRLVAILDGTEADTLLRERSVGPLEGFRSRQGRPFTASLKLTDANEVTFDFGDGGADDSGEAPDFSGLEPLGPCPKCGARVFELPQAYVCEKAVGPEKTCDFRSGRVILQRPVERAQMQKLLASGKTDLLQFVSARTRRPFAAFLVRQPDGKIGFEFQAKEAGKGGARGTRVPVALRVLGPHPRDKKPVELHAGRYGPYVKHGDVNATVPDRDKAESITLDEAVALLDEKAAHQRGGAGGRRPSRAASTTPTAPPKGRSVAAAADRRKSAAANSAPRPAPSVSPPGPTIKTKPTGRSRRSSAK